MIPNAEVIQVSGEKELETITLKRSDTGEESKVPTKALFIHIGAKPGTAWLNNIVLKNENGFILTGTELMKERSFDSFANFRENLSCPKQVCREYLPR